MCNIHGDGDDLDGNQCYHRFGCHVGIFWLVDPLAAAASCQHVWTIVGQDILNQDLGAFSVGVVFEVETLI